MISNLEGEKIHKMERFQGKILPIVLLVLILVGITYLLPKSKPLSCLDLRTLTNFINNTMNPQGSISYYNLLPASHKTYSWRKNPNEPYRVYSALDYSYGIDYNQDVTLTDKYFREKVVSRLASEGFIPDSVNTDLLRTHPVLDLKLSRYGFIKGDERLGIWIGSRDKTSNLTVTCGLPDPKIDSYYNPIIAQSNFDKFSEVDILGIQDNKVLLNVLNSVGVAECWEKVENKWQKYYSGQGSVIKQICPPQNRY